MNDSLMVYDENELLRRMEPLRKVPGYQGALFITNDLLLLSNLMPYSDERAVEVVTPLLEVVVDFKESGRVTVGLAIQASTFQLIHFPLRHGYLLLRVSRDLALRDLEQPVRDITVAIEQDLPSFEWEMLYEHEEVEEEIDFPQPETIATIGQPMLPPPDIARRLMNAS